MMKQSPIMDSASKFCKKNGGEINAIISQTGKIKLLLTMKTQQPSQNKSYFNKYVHLIFSKGEF